MRQIPLALSAPEPASFDNYVAGSNGEAVAALQALIDAAPAPDAGQPCLLYLWGEPGTGKSHLLAALAGAVGPRALALGADSAPAAFEAALAALAPGAATQVAPVAIVDDCERLDDVHQQQVFHLFNRIAARPDAAFVAAGAQPPRALALREELRTRLGAGNIIRLSLLSDAQKAEALRRAARGRGIALPEELLQWLLTHRSRDIRWLLRLLDALDRYALERKRAITLPLLREFELAGLLIKSP
ncbi:MAG: DnaA regulatory inactivator Hda [Burkholderiaceae bacterium]